MGDRGVCDITWLRTRVKTGNKGLYQFIIWQGNSERSDWFFLGRDFTIRTVSTETVQAVYFFVS